MGHQKIKKTSVCIKRVVLSKAVHQFDQGSFTHTVFWKKCCSFFVPKLGVNSKGMENIKEGLIRLLPAGSTFGLRSKTAVVFFQKTLCVKPP